MPIVIQSRLGLRKMDSHIVQNSTVMERLLMRCFSHRVIEIDNNPYMLRFFIWGSKGEGDDGRAIRLHKIMLSDDVRIFHNHPYRFASMLLRGSYLEHTPAESKRYGAGRINHKRIEDWHTLELDRGNVWSLVFTGKRQQDWGFWTGDENDKPLSWREYEAQYDS